MVEQCWFRDKRESDPVNAPLVCLECPRGKTMQFMHVKNEEMEHFINGFMLALYKIAIGLSLSKELSDRTRNYLLGIEIETKCTLDRGVSVEELEKGIDTVRKNFQTL